MQTDPVEEWRRLTEHYRGLTDDQLEELAADFADLTEAAQQVLRGELRHRDLDQPQIGDVARKNAKPFRIPQPEPSADPTAAAAGGQETNPPHEYTWKTLLCECNQREHAWQISEVLRRAGIESWIDGPGIYSPYSELDLTNPRVLVAADQLDQAREIASRPIPQDVIDESRETVPEFELPECPGCGAADPLLESIEPATSGDANRAEDNGRMQRRI